VIVKVCGVCSAEIAEVAVAAGADWLGLVLVPASPRYADDAAARAVVEAVGARVDLVGVMVDATPADCDEAAGRYGLSAVQLHGRVPRSMAAASRIPVIRAINARCAAEALTDAWWADGTVLLDAAPGADGLPGGTGERVGVAVAAALARHRRLVLAGGLSAANVAGAVDAVRPYGVDASSGLESAPGVKDAARVVAYVEAARAAEASLQLGARA
jgi:phosphoribosylanthranilate isomerase